MRISSQSLIELLAPGYAVSRSGSKAELYSCSLPSAKQELNLSDLKASRTKTDSADSKRKDFQTFNPTRKIMHDRDFAYLSSS